MSASNRLQQGFQAGAAARLVGAGQGLEIGQPQLGQVGQYQPLLGAAARQGWIARQPVDALGQGDELVGQRPRIGLVGQQAGPARARPGACSDNAGGRSWHYRRSRAGPRAPSPPRRVSDTQRAPQQARHLYAIARACGPCRGRSSDWPRVRFSATSPLKAASRLMPASSSSSTSLSTPRASRQAGSGAVWPAVAEASTIAVRSAIRSTIRWLSVRHMSTEIRSRTLEATRWRSDERRAQTAGAVRIEDHREQLSFGLDRGLRAGSGRESQDRSGSAWSATRKQDGQLGNLGHARFLGQADEDSAEQADDAFGPLDIAAQPVEVVGMAAGEVAPRAAEP